MRQLTIEHFKVLCEQAVIRPRLRRNLRFSATTAHITAKDWQDTELLAVPDRTGSGGVLLAELLDGIYAVPYRLSQRLTDKTGRAQPVICDFCRTWQAGGNAARITFEKNTNTYNTITFLCCADLACSQHVRGDTAAARSSRVHLREDIRPQQRIIRLKTQLTQVMNDIGARKLGI